MPLIRPGSACVHPSHIDRLPGFGDLEVVSVAGKPAMQPGVVFQHDGHLVVGTQRSDALDIDLDVARVLGVDGDLATPQSNYLAGETITVVQHDLIGAAQTRHRQ